MNAEREMDQADGLGADEDARDAQLAAGTDPMSVEAELALPEGCTGAVMYDRGGRPSIQHDAGTCPIHELDGPVVQVEYEVPVSAFVNVETGEVERVCVWDEQIRSFPKERSDVVKEDYSGPVNEVTAVKARGIAENSEWPSWSFGR